MLLSSNLIYVLHNYIGVHKKFWKKRVTDRNDCFHWTLIPPSSNLNCWAQLHELIPDYQYARTHLKPQNFTWITIFIMKFYNVMPIANIFSSYWSYIYGISESQKNAFINLNEMRTEHRTENPIIYWLKRWNFSRMNILKLQNSLSWEYYKWNNAVLFLGQILTRISKVVILGVYLSRSTHINQFRTLTRKLVAIYRRMKHLESNSVGVNVAILPVGKQHDIAFEISERVG